MPIMLYLCIMKQKDITFMSYSTLLNRNFRCKINGVLYGYSGLCNHVGMVRANELIKRALFSSVQVFCPKSLCCGNEIKFYSK